MSDAPYNKPGTPTYLYDKTGEMIHVGDRVEFTDYSGAQWSGIITFEDGVFTVSILDVECLKNPDDWTRAHAWTDSRWWGTQVGYGEYGSWNCPRKPLTSIAGNFKDFETEYRPLGEKHGWGKRFLPVLVLTKWQQVEAA